MGERWGGNEKENGNSNSGERIDGEGAKGGWKERGGDRRGKRGGERGKGEGRMWGRERER